MDDKPPTVAAPHRPRDPRSGLGPWFLVLAASCGGTERSGPAAGGTADAGGTRADASAPDDAARVDDAASSRVDGSAPGTDGGAPRGSKPNLIFVLTDDLAWNLVEFMPHVKQMQAQGVTFSHYFVTDSLCCPSRTSMFTGKYPHASGVFTNSGDDGGYAVYLSQGNDAQTFAVALQGNGYRTAMMGKFLNGYDPAMDGPAMGWSHWAVAGNGYPEFNYSLNQDDALTPYGNQPADYLTDVIAGLGKSFISEQSQAPFLIELATFAPHAPYTPAPRHAQLFPDLKYPRTPAFAARPKASDPAWLRAVPALTTTEITKIESSFRKRVQAVQAVDEMIGTLQATLAATGHDRDTYVFFASDNGYHMGERSQRPGKQTAFDTDIRVPLIVTGPGIPAGMTIDEITQNIDLCPTFAELGQTAAPTTINGRSLVALLQGRAVQGWRDAALVEHHDPKFDPTDPDAVHTGIAGPPTYAALRTTDAVYVEYSGGETEYHDRRTDPDELENTASSLTPAQVARLHSAIAAIVACRTSDQCWAAQHLSPAPGGP